MFTDRQKEILRYVCDGLTYEKTGKKFSLSERTVRTELDAMVNIMEVDDIRELIILSVKYGIVTPTSSCTLDFKKYGALPLLIAQGLSNKEISTILKINEGAVKQRVYKMFRDLQVQNRHQFIALYIASSPND